MGRQVSQIRALDERSNQRRLGNGSSERNRHDDDVRRVHHGVTQLVLRASSQGDALGMVPHAHQGLRHRSFVRQARRLQLLGQQGTLRRHRRYRTKRARFALFPRHVRRHAFLDAVAHGIHHHRVRADENGQLDSVRRRAHHRSSLHAREPRVRQGGQWERHGNDHDAARPRFDATSSALASRRDGATRARVGREHGFPRHLLVHHVLEKLRQLWRRRGRLPHRVG